jgi:hypothetical protein
MTRRPALEYLDSLHVLDCCQCHMTFAIIDSFRLSRQNDHNLFYCPAGHPQQYSGQSDGERAKSQVAELKRQLASRQDDLRAERAKLAEANGELTRARRELTRTRTRAEAGVCLHCHRTFADVARHVANRHPEVAGG